MKFRIVFNNDCMSVGPRFVETENMDGSPIQRAQDVFKWTGSADGQLKYLEIDTEKLIKND